MENEKIRIDLHLRELMPAFFDNLRQDLADSRAALNAGEHACAARICHGMKGAAYGFGFQRMGDLCRAAESAAREAACRDVMEQRLADLERYVENVDVEYVDAGEF